MDKADFLFKDYELKIRYLTDHLSRMWSRFNYMLSIQTVIAGGKFLGDSEKYQGQFIFTGFLFASIWFLLAIQDRYLFVLYRKQVKTAFNKLEIKDVENIDHVGQVECTIEKVTIAWHTRRWEGLSSTKMAVFVPIVIAFLWGAYGLYALIDSGILKFVFGQG